MVCVCVCACVCVRACVCVFRQDMLLRSSAVALIANSREGICMCINFVCAYICIMYF